MINIKNFTSYKSLSISLTSRGLTLISGQNGSGKSTLCDTFPWILFGKTSKNISTNDVVAWGATEPTQGAVTVGNCAVYRTRGLKPKDNDLYFTIDGGIPQRGKDITDTQRLIDTHLGYSYQGFILSHYIHEFSIANTFFSATAKQRKDILDQLIDVTELQRISKTLDLDKKASNKAYEEVERKYSQEEYKHAHLLTMQSRLDQQKALADSKKASLNAQIAKKTRDFNDELQLLTDEITSLKGNSCPTCGAPAHVKEIMELKEALNKIRADKIEVSHLSAMLKQQEAPVYVNAEDLGACHAKMQELKSAFLEQGSTLADQEELQQLIKTCRASLTMSAVSRLEEGTNRLLSNFFDGEFTVSLLMDTLEDKIDVTVTNGSFACSYEQLSKGQRQVLKFCFSLTAMREVQMAKGIKPEAIFLDEIFDGMSDITKDKAFQVLRRLESEYASIFVVEHSIELKAKFDNIWEVTMTEGHSEVYEKP